MRVHRHAFVSASSARNLPLIGTYMLKNQRILRCQSRSSDNPKNVFEIDQKSVGSVLAKLGLTELCKGSGIPGPQNPKYRREVEG